MVYSLIYNQANSRMTLVCDSCDERTFIGFENDDELKSYTEEMGINIPLGRCFDGYAAWKAAR